MQFEAIPAELRARRQWTVWRPVVGPNKITKPPYRADGSDRPASSTDPSTWGTYEDAVACYEANRSAYGGIGFMLTVDDPYVVLDVDDGSKVVEPYYATMRQEMIAAILALGTYTEASPSGVGLHAWVRGKLPVAGRKITPVAIEAYASVRFMTCTGLPVPQSGVEILDGQALLEEMGLCREAPEVSVEDDPRKPLGLTDDQVMGLCWVNASFRDRWHRTAWGDPPHDWSKGFMELVRVLNMHSGSVEQIHRLACRAPMVTNSAAHRKGEARWIKADRIFLGELKRVREYDSGDSYHRDFGERVMAAIDAETKRRRVAEMEKLAAQLEQADEVEGLSQQSREVLGRFSNWLGAETTKLTPPPGVVGEMVEAACRASRVPFLLYAVPATLATMAGITARSYVPDVGGPLNLNYVLLASTATGKTQSMKVWDGFLQQALSVLPMTAKPVNRILSEGTSSIQGLWDDIQQVPCCVWFIEEAAKQLNAMANVKNATDENLLAAYNQFYDAGEHNKQISPPRSVNAKNASLNAIRKLCVSTFWSTTPDMFEVSEKNVTNGFVSRVVFIRYTGPGGEQVRQPDTELPIHLRDRLAQLLAQASAMDEHYRINEVTAATHQRQVNTQPVQDLAWELTQVCAGITRDANSKALPAVYTAFGRVAQSALRLACTLAIIENPWNPVVQPVQYRWAIGYLLQNLALLLSDMDKGEIGDNASDEIRTLQRVMTQMVRKGMAKGKPGLPRNAVHHALRDQALLRKHKDGASRGASWAIKVAVEEGYVEEVQDQDRGKGRPTTYLRLCLRDAG